MLAPVNLENENLIIQSFDATDFQRWSDMVDDIYALLSDNQTLKYLTFKRLNSRTEADAWLKNALISLHCRRNYLHFIRTKSNNRIIGLIDVISPALAKEHYRLQKYPYFIEFCIKTECSQKKLMSSLLPDFLDALRNQQIGEIAAVINRQNIAAQKVLSRSGFSYDRFFDDKDQFRILTNKVDQLNNKPNSDKLSAAFDQLSITLDKDEMECINSRNRLHGNLPQNKDSKLSDQELLNVLANRLGMLSSMLLLKLSGFNGFVIDRGMTEVIKWRMIMNGETVRGGNYLRNINEPK